MNYPITEPQLLKKISKIDQEKRLVADDSTHHLTKWLKKDEFYMNKYAAIAFLDSNYEKSTKSYHKRLNFIMNFENHLMKYSRDGKDDRLHSLFTRMPSDLKQFVQFTRRNIVEVDITNSQPLFLVLLLKEIKLIHDDLTKKNLSFKGLKKGVRYILSSYINNKYQCDYYKNTDKYRIDINILSINISTILSKNPETLDFTDILLFEKLVVEGTIYEHIAEVLLRRKSVWKKGTHYCVNLFNKEKNIQEIKEFSSLRKCVKTVMLNALYSPPNTKGLKAINDLKKEFPNLFLILNSIKGNNSKDFPIYLQRMEAKFILDICSKKIHNQNPGILLISRHDSLSTTEEHADFLKNVMHEMLNDYLGFSVNLKKELW